MDVALLTFLIVLNALFAMSEMALTASRKARLQVMVETGDAGARAAMELHDDPTKFQDLRIGRIDAILIDRLAALEYAKKAKDTAAAGEAFSRQEAGIALRKGEPELLEAVNQALDKLRADGTLKKLSEKYFNADVTQ